jgi:diguanylate cyclase (GGDEF)-like protein
MVSLSVPPRNEPPPMPASARQTRPALVLIANDEEWSARSLETILGPQGFAVLRAYNGRQTLDLARSARPDVVILDSRLPDAPGVEICRMLTTSGILGPATPIVMTTSDPSGRAQELTALQAGAWEFTMFPLDGDVLLSKLGTFVRAKRESDAVREDGLLDPSTGLYNARGLARRAREIGAEASRRRNPLACIAFAPDTASSPLSDQELDRLAIRIAEHLGATLDRAARLSDVVGRLGQSEFAIIAPDTEAAGAVRLAERVLGLIAALPFEGEGSGVTARAGYCAVPDFAEASIDAVEMLVRAASALRQAPASRTAPVIQSFDIAAFSRG